MMKNVAISLMAIFLMACTGNKNPHFLRTRERGFECKRTVAGNLAGR